MLTQMSFSHISPEEARYEPQAINRLNDHFQQLIDKKSIQCASYMLMRDGEIFAGGAFGRLSHKDDNHAPFNIDSIRKSASVSKLFTATAVFQLIEQGKLFLDQRVSNWTEEFKHPLFERIQIWHLLSHTSGLQADGGYYTEPYSRGWWSVLFAFDPDRDSEKKSEDEFARLRRTAWIRAMLSGKPLHEPGEAYAYSTIGYAALAEIVVRASGMPFESYVMTHIVEPLGMTRSFYEVPESLRSEVCTVNDWDEKHLKDEEDGNDPYAHLAMPPRGGYGLYSTPEDLCKFGNMLLGMGTWRGVKILSRKSVERMLRKPSGKIGGVHWGNRLEDVPFGLGPWMPSCDEWVSPGSFGHEGAGRCKLIVDPRERAVIVFFTPSASDWSAESVISPQTIIWSGWQ